MRGTAEGARSGGTDEWVDAGSSNSMYVCMLYCTVLYTVYCMYTVSMQMGTPGARNTVQCSGEGTDAHERERESPQTRVCLGSGRQDRTGQARQADRADRAGQGRAGRQAGDTRLNRQAVQLWPRNLQEGEDVFPVILPLPLHFTYTLTHHTDATRRTAPHRPHRSHLIVPCASRVFPPRPRPLPLRPPRRHRRR